MASLVLLPSNQGHPELFDIDYNCDEMDKKDNDIVGNGGSEICIRRKSDWSEVVREKDGGAGDGFIRFKSFI